MVMRDLEIHTIIITTLSHQSPCPVMRGLITLHDLTKCKITSLFVTMISLLSSKWRSHSLNMLH